MAAKSSTIDPDEISHFAKDSAQWWDEQGPFAPIHRINPVRLDYLKGVICTHYGRDVKSLSALKGLTLLDAGCGGGLVCEPMARMGADVMGIDADAVAIDAAIAHAARSGLDIAYTCGTTDELKQQFDIVLALEIVEHVADVDKFVQSCVDCCRPGGIIVFSTLNKTIKSMALAKIAAEYILRWVPAGTHDWKKFIRPSTLAASLRRAGATPMEIKGLVFNPMKGEFSISSNDLNVNYFIAATKDRI
ncbi:MAG: bifunctional 2-polyprenyl-6-hydroxyphenol methylase/3-demethylubiquinol 3-O-methyltransferase UbiG [Micavibrio sp.]